MCVVTVIERAHFVVLQSENFLNVTLCRLITSCNRSGQIPYRLESHTQTRRKCDIRSETIVDSEFDEKGPLIFYCKLERNGRISIHFVSPNAPI